MGDVGDIFRAMRDASKERRAKAWSTNVQKAAAIDGIPYEIKNFGHHYIYTVGPHKFDYWPASDKFCIRSEMRYGVGWRKLEAAMWAAHKNLPKPEGRE